MDEAPLSFTGRLTLQDVLDLHRYQALCLVRPSIRWLLGIVSFLIVVFCIWVTVLGIAKSPVWPILILCAYFPVGWWYERRWAVRRHYRHHPEQFLESTVKVTRDDVAVSNASMDLRLAWKHVTLLLDTPCGLLFMVPPTGVLCWLPQRLFEGNGDKQTIIRYASENKVRVRTMR